MFSFKECLLFLMHFPSSISNPQGLIQALLSDIVERLCAYIL
ncbi:unnamed protein product [Larinioides sclopetarius]|uniref:Maturase K n=1 Tax=Larinioides sclopetarius TaxID=280406 RepID=A0AAV2AUG9_9ARAC